VGSAPNSTATWYTVFGLLGVEGFEGIAGLGVAGLDPPEPCEEPELEEPEPLVELGVLDVEVAVLPAGDAALLAFEPGSGVNGLCTAPFRCSETPPVVSATAFSGVIWLIATPDGVAAPREIVAVGVAAVEPPPRIA